MAQQRMGKIRLIQIARESIPLRQRDKRERVALLRAAEAAEQNQSVVSHASRIAPLSAEETSFA